MPTLHYLFGPTANPKVLPQLVSPSHFLDLRTLIAALLFF
jgi:hypothetical protein